MRDERLADLPGQVAEPRRGTGDFLLAGLDEPLAAEATLRGADAVRGTLQVLEPIAHKIDRRLEVAPSSIPHLSTLMLLSISAIGEAVGAPLPAPTFDVDGRLEDLILDHDLSREDKVTLALLSLGRGRMDDVGLLFGKGAPKPDAAGADPVALAQVLARALKSGTRSKDVEPAWDAFLRGFPAALDSGKAEWRHLLLAARIALARHGKTPPAQVADALHRRIVELAAEDSA
jgi:hypothetical protein